MCGLSIQKEWHDGREFGAQGSWLVPTEVLSTFETTEQMLYPVIPKSHRQLVEAPQYQAFPAFFFAQRFF